MKNKLHYTQKARRDLDEIWNYIAVELQNRSAAENVVDRIMNAIDQLESFAAIGSRLPAMPLPDRGYRYLVSGDYMIFYRTEGNDVYIDRVLYGRREYLKALFESDLSDDALS